MTPGMSAKRSLSPNLSVSKGSIKVIRVMHMNRAQTATMCRNSAAIPKRELLLEFNGLAVSDNSSQKLEEALNKAPILRLDQIKSPDKYSVICTVKASLKANSKQEKETVPLTATS